jgi:hypothetical protein
MHQGKYSRYKSDGSDNPAWKNTVAMLTAVLGDEIQPAADRAQAAEILKWNLERSKTLDPDVAAFLAEIDCSSLWEWGDRFVLRDVTDQKGVTRREVVFVGSPFMSSVAKVVTPAVEVESGEEI